MLTIESRALGKTQLLKVTGSIDSATAHQLSEAVQTQLDARRYWLIADFSGVKFASSAGLRSLLIGVKEARKASGDLRVAAVQPSVLKVLQLAGFTNIIQTFDSVDAAARSFG